MKTPRMGVSSADPDHLDAYVAAARDLNEALRHRLGALVDAYDRVVPRLRWGVFDARATLDGLATYIGLNDADDEWVAAIVARFRAADDGGGGAVALDDAPIDGALRAAGVAAGPRPTSRSTTRSWRAPRRRRATPTIRSAPPPATSSSGRWIWSVPSRVAITGWVRTYSSRWLEPGPFGRGWASWASVRLEAVGERRGGGAAGRAAGARSSATGPVGHRRVTGLSADLVAGRGRVAAALVRPGPVVVRRATVAWPPSPRRPEAPRRSTASSAGSSGSFTRAGGRCRSSGPARRVGAVRVERRARRCATGTTAPATSWRWTGPGPGRRRYEVGDGLVVAVIDADGVELVRNAYDPDGRVRWQRSPLRRRTTFRYPRRGRHGGRGRRAAGRPSPTCTTRPGGSSGWWTTTAHA